MLALYRVLLLLLHLQFSHQDNALGLNILQQLTKFTQKYKIKRNINKLIKFQTYIIYMMYINILRYGRCETAALNLKDI